MNYVTHTEKYIDDKNNVIWRVYSQSKRTFSSITQPTETFTHDNYEPNIGEKVLLQHHVLGDDVDDWLLFGCDVTDAFLYYGKKSKIEKAYDDIKLHLSKTIRAIDIAQNLESDMVSIWHLDNGYSIIISNVDAQYMSLDRNSYFPKLQNYPEVLVITGGKIANEVTIIDIVTGNVDSDLDGLVSINNIELSKFDKNETKLWESFKKSFKKYIKV